MKAGITPFTMRQGRKNSKSSSEKNESLAFSLFDDRLSMVRSKDPLEAKILSLVLPVATSSQRHEMSYSFKNLDEKYYHFR